jgi:hypothetical protein
MLQVLFMGGAVARASKVAALVEPARRASKKPLHETLVRNEVIYLFMEQLA